MKRNQRKRDFLEQRRADTNAYLHNLLNPSLLDIHDGLLESIFIFLQHSLLDQSKYPLCKEVNVIHMAQIFSQIFVFPQGILPINYI